MSTIYSKFQLVVKGKNPTELGRKIMQILKIRFRRKKSLVSFVCNTVGPQQIEQRDRQQQLQFFRAEKSPAVSLRSTPKFSFPFALSILLMFCAHPGVRTPSLECKHSLRGRIISG